MAKKGLDFLLSHSSACEELRVGFYGGEPLLEFELIKRCVEYMETQTKDKAVHYQITTNGTLLKGEILTYLIEKSLKSRLVLTDLKRSTTDTENLLEVTKAAMTP